MFAKTLARQLNAPKGLLGLFVGRGMNSMNREMNVFTVRCLDVERHHRVLDVGFGGGVSLRLLNRAADLGQIVGVEMSGTMLATARCAHRDAIRAGRMRLERGRMESLPFADSAFDRVCTVNTLYFWTDLAAGIAGAHRVLDRGGKFALSFRPRADMLELPFTKFGFTLYDCETISRALTKQGFGDVCFSRGQDEHLDFICAVATKQ